MNAGTTIDRVVIGYDGSPSADAALDAAIEEARARGVRLHVVHAIDVLLFLPGRDDRHEKAAQRAVQDAYARAAAVLGEHAVTTHIEPGVASHVILGQAQAGDLVVLGSHGFRPVAQLFVGSTSEGVAAHAQCPVLVVRDPAQHPHGHIAVGVDESPGSVLALRHALSIAARDGATVRAIAAVPTIIDAAGMIAGPDEVALKESATRLAHTVAEVSGDSAVTVEQHVVQAHPIEALHEHSRTARLLVVGSRGRNAVASMVLGSVSRRLVHTAYCPVLVIHS